MATLLFYVLNKTELDLFTSAMGKKKKKAYELKILYKIIL